MWRNFVLLGAATRFPVGNDEIAPRRLTGLGVAKREIAMGCALCAEAVRISRKFFDILETKR